MTTDEVREIVRHKIEEERSQLQATLDSTQRLEGKVATEHDKADKAYWKLASRDLDAEPTAKELAAQHARDATFTRLSQVWAALAATKRKLDKLDEPYEFDRRLAERERLITLQQQRNGGGSNMSTATARAPKREVPSEVKKRIVKEIRAGKGLSTVANGLNADKVKTPGAAEWYPQAVRRIFLAETGESGIKSVRKSAPLASRELKNRAPAATRKVATAARKTATATPLSRKAQAAGTSRGGTGSKKKTAAARKRKTAAARKRNGTRKR